MRYFARPNLAPAFLALAGYSTQRATLIASMCIKAVEAKAALPSGSIVRAHARDPRTRIRYTPVHPAPALVYVSVHSSITWHPNSPLASGEPLCCKGSLWRTVSALTSISQVLLLKYLRVLTFHFGHT